MWKDLLNEFISGFTVETIRYFSFAGIAFLVFYITGRKFLARYKIQQKYPHYKNMVREIKYSLLSMAIFGLNGVFVFIMYKHGYTRLYNNFSDHSVGYFILSILIFIVAHDFYFYWTHRFMHLKSIYPYVHKIHHLSHDPTPWAAYAFHPVEAFIQAAIFPILVVIVPVHPLAVLVWGLWQTSLNVMGHLGFELFWSGFTTRKFTRWSNTSTHHNMHHKYANANYGLYFNFWDRMMGTNHPEYHQQFEMVKERTKNFNPLLSPTNTYPNFQATKSPETGPSME